MIIGAIKPSIRIAIFNPFLNVTATTEGVEGNFIPTMAAMETSLMGSENEDQIDHLRSKTYNSVLKKSMEISPANPQIIALKEIIQK